MLVREIDGRYRGPAFCDKDGSMAQSMLYELPIMDRLVNLQERFHHLIPREMDIYEEFGISRSFHRGATLTARVK